MIQRWKDIPIKRCKGCWALMNQNRIIGGRKIWKSEYTKKNNCSRECATRTSMFTRISGGYRPQLILQQHQKPDREVLNKLWNKYKKYRDIAKELGVHEESVSRWLGKRRHMIDPSDVYLEEDTIHTKTKPIGSGKKKASIV